MWWQGHGNWGGWWAVGWVCWMLVLWGGIGAGAVFLVRRWRRWRPPVGSSPEDILAERYARGEISTEEYHERLEVLRHRHG